MKHAKGLLWAMLLIGSAPALAAPENLLRMDNPSGSWLKASTAQAADLPNAQKCALAHDEVLEYTQLSAAANNHLHVRLPRNYPNCALSEGYLFAPHVATQAFSLTVTAATVFKRQPADSSTLPVGDKCNLPAGLYRTSAAVTRSQGHYAVNFATVPAGCGFSSGYVFDGHAAAGLQAVSLRVGSLLKASTADSSALPESQKCSLPAGTHLLSAPPAGDATHYQVTLVQAPAGCGFRSGFVFAQHTNFDLPRAAGGNYTWPQPGSDLGSGWCICRSIGTSPHIGQDFVQWGAKRAVAIEAGRVSSISFSSTCGYIVTLTDDYGGQWRYVHLNQPQVGQGARVSNGQTLASISQYPTSACGTGPHLHLERRSAGEFGDSPTGRSCQVGFRTCYYDPLTPFHGAARADASAVQMPLRVASADAADGPACRASTGLPAARFEAALRAHRESAHGLVVDLEVADVDGGEGRQAVAGSVVLSGNPGNRCDLSAGLDCIVNWQLLARDATGGWSRLFVDAGVRNLRPERELAESHCVPEQASGEFMVLVTTAEGRRIRQRVVMP